VKALVAIARQYGYDFSLLKAVDEINRKTAENFVGKITRHFNNTLKGKRIAVLGLSFKPNTDDMREAPSIYIIHQLVKYGAKVVAYDPVAMENARRVLPPSVTFARSAYAAADGTDAVAVVTEWNEFRQLIWYVFPWNENTRSV
jgi:UDPglucose 6-dehydrogenase